MGGIILAVLAGGLALLILTRAKKNKKKTAFVVMSSVLLALAGAASLFIGVPALLFDQANTQKTVMLLVLALGVLGVVIATGAESRMVDVLLLIGMVMAVWASFRLLPNGPAAFAYLGPSLGSLGGQFLQIMSHFVGMLHS